MSAYEISILSVIGINVILAVSLNMISGFCGQISLGHSAFFGAGAYAAALAMVGIGNAVLAIFLAVIAGACSGWRSDLLRSGCAPTFWPSPPSA